MYLLRTVAMLILERRVSWFLRVGNMARILLAEWQEGGFWLSKISENATIARHSLAMKYRQLSS